MRSFVVAPPVPGAGCGTCPCSPPLTVDAYLAKVAQSSCRNSATCGVIGASEEKDCEEQAANDAKNFPQPYSPSEAVSAHRITFDPVKAQKCVDAKAAAGCTVDQ